MKIADFGLSRVVEVDAVASVTPPVMAQAIADQSERKVISGSEPTDEEDRSEADTVEMDHDHGVQYLQSPLSNHVFRDQQSHADHEMQEQQQNQKMFASLPLPPVNAPLGLIGGFPMVPKVPLKRALTKHVVSKSVTEIHSCNAMHDAICRDLFYEICDLSAKDSEGSPNHLYKFKYPPRYDIITLIEHRLPDGTALQKSSFVRTTPPQWMSGQVSIPIHLSYLLPIDSIFINIAH